MDNLVVEKVWQDIYMMSVRISATSKFVQIYHDYYVGYPNLEEYGKAISEYTHNFSSECYIETEPKRENSSPSFSMLLLPADYTGHVTLELDFDIDDNAEKKHRACFYISSELGLVDRFGKALQSMAAGKIDRCELNLAR